MKPRFTKKRQAQLDQLINDLAEDMNLKRWKQKDFIDCINYQQDALCTQANNFSRRIDKVRLQFLRMFRHLRFP